MRPWPAIRSSTFCAAAPGRAGSTCSCCSWSSPAISIASGNGHFGTWTTNDGGFVTHHGVELTLPGGLFLAWAGSSACFRSSTWSLDRHAWTPPPAQRLGDRLAGTTVVPISHP
jgi:hypothetical protein